MWKVYLLIAHSEDIPNGQWKVTGKAKLWELIKLYFSLHLKYFELLLYCYRLAVEVKKFTFWLNTISFSNNTFVRPLNIKADVFSSISAVVTTLVVQLKSVSSTEKMRNLLVKCAHETKRHLLYQFKTCRVCGFGCHLLNSSSRCPNMRWTLQRPHVIMDMYVSCDL